MVQQDQEVHLAESTVLHIVLWNLNVMTYTVFITAIASIQSNILNSYGYSFSEICSQNNNNYYVQTPNPKP